MIKKIHYERELDDCKRGHGPYLFLKDMSHIYANDIENNVYYKCICLECSLLSDYKMTRTDRKMLVDINSKDNKLSEFYAIRERYEKLKELGIDKEEIIKTINEEYKNENKEKVKSLIIDE